MDIKIVLGTAAVLCEVISAVLYLSDIFRGNTKPHLYTNLVWSIVMSIAFGGMIIGGGGAGVWATGAALLLVLTTLVLSFKWGTTDITRSDKVFLSTALLAIVPWIITKNPLGSVILASVIDACGIAPTLRKTWRAPFTESLGAWIFALLRTGFQIVALAVYTPLTVIYLVEVLIVDIALVTIVLYQRQRIKL